MEIKNNYFNGQVLLKEVKTLRDGRPYTVRENRQRFFYPDEWMAFFDKLKTSQRCTFNSLINTGARINEIRNVLISDIDFNRNSIVLRFTKTRNKDGQRKMRVIPVSKQYIRFLRYEVIPHYKLKHNDKLPILSTPASNIAMRKALNNIKLKDAQMFSVHNVRKTLETWLMALNIDSLKVAMHFGHNISIAQKFYVSPESFSFEDKKMMRQIIGDLYGTQRY